MIPGAMAALVGAKILVVEDDTFILRMMRDILSKDFLVLGEESAEAGIHVLERERVDAVVADQMLPGMLGTDFLQRAAQMQPHAARILVTASGRITDAQDAINLAKVKRFLQKPFRPDELRRVVGESVHEAAMTQIRDQLVAELKQRNGVLADALSLLEEKGRHLQRNLDQRNAAVEEVAHKLESLAIRDGLTGTFNHRYLQEALVAELDNARRRRRSFALVLVDVDGFRSYNLTHGYAEGDVLLRRIAEAMASPPKSGDNELVARFGGDIFAAILSGADVQRAQRYADRVLREIARVPGSQHNPSLKSATASAGVAMFPGAGERAETLIDAATQAVERAKRDHGGNCSVLCPQLGGMDAPAVR